MEIESIVFNSNQYGIFDLSQVNIDINTQISLAEIPILTNLLKEITASSIDVSGLNVPVDVSINGVDISFNITSSDASFTYLNAGSDIMINNTIIDTPNLALLTYLDVSGFSTFDNSYIIGANTYGDFYGSITDLDPSSLVYVTEILDFSFVAAPDAMNNDASNNYYVAFNPTSPSSSNYWLSKAVNSPLNAHQIIDGDVSGYYPLSVIEPSFNHDYAMGSYNANTDGPLPDPFNYYYPSTSYGLPNVDSISNVNTNNNYDPVNDMQIYAISSLQDNGSPTFNDNFGSWKFEYAQNDTSNAPVVSSSESNLNNLPFFQGVDSSKNHPFEPLPSSLTDSSLNALFPGLDSTNFEFQITATPGYGGYHFANETDSGNYYTNILSDNSVQLEYSGLQDSQTYMRNDYQNRSHTLNITNGSLTISGESYSNTSNASLFTSGLGNEAEHLNNDYYHVNGSILLQVNAQNNRTTVSGSNYGNLTSISVNYPGETGGDNSVISMEYMNSISNIDIAATCLLEGLHKVDSSSGYMYSMNNTTATYDASSMSTLYIESSSPYLTSYRASGFDSSKYTYIAIDANTYLTDISSTNNLYDITSSPFGLPVPYTGFEPLVAGFNTNWTPMYFNAHSINLLDLCFNNYRAVFRPKTLTDLSNNNDGFIRVDDSSGWQFVVGFGESDGTTDPSFVYGVSDHSGQYLFTKYDNLNNAGTTTSLPFPREYGLNITDLVDTDNTNLDISYSFTLKYTSTGDARGKDIVIFTPTDPTQFHAPFDQSFTITPITPAGNNTSYSAYVQVPLGQYYNLYLKTPTLHSSSNGSSEVITGATTTTLTFSKGGLLSLLGAVQGSNDASSNFVDPSFTEYGWTTITTTPNDPSGTSFASVGIYHNFDAQLNVSTQYSIDPTSKINIRSDFTPDASGVNTSTFHLVYPMYAMQLNGTLASTFNIVGYTYSNNDDAITESINRNFNPADFSSYPNSLPNSNSVINSNNEIHFTYTLINASGEVGPNYLYIQGISGNVIDISMTFARSIRSNMAVWYSQHDIYEVDVSLSGIEYGESYNTTYVLGNLDSSHNNSSLQLVDGVYLTNTHGVQTNDYVYFKVNGDSIQVRMLDNSDIYSEQNAYYTSIEEITDNNGLNIYSNHTPNYTRSLLLPYYRGYTNNGAHQQQYAIIRTPTTANFVLSGNGGSIPDQSYNIGDLYSNLNVDMNFVSNNPSSVPSIGLLGIFFSSSDSMFTSSVITYGATNQYPVNVTGDAVLVYEYANGVVVSDYYTNLAATNGRLADFGPGTSNIYNAIFAGKVIANKYNNGYVETYTITRAAQRLNIYYDPSYIGNPNDFNWNNEYTVLSTDLLGAGLQLSPSITLFGPTRNMNIENTPTTYLVIPPPFLGFTALSTDAATQPSVLPFDIANMGAYDPTQLITWYLPTQMDPTNSNVDMSYNPFSDITEIVYEYNYNSNLLTSLNNMTFYLNNENMLTYYVNSDSNTKSFPLNSQGNYLTITENVFGGNGNTRNTLFSGYLQDLSPSGVHGANHNFDSLIVADFSNQLYTIVYAQDLMSYGIDNGANTKITLNIQDAFLHDVSSITIIRSTKSTSNLYGVSPVIDNSGEYALKLYKYVSTSVDYGNLANYNHSCTFYADKYYTKEPITLHSPPDFSYNVPAYNLHVQRSQFTSSDIDICMNPWVQDLSFNTSNINFEIVALDQSGVQIIQSMFNVFYLTEALNINYITLPDLVHIESGDGSPVFRVLYNGTTISPMLSTSQIIINPIANFENFSNGNAGQEFVDFNVDTNIGTMADASGGYNK
jgi:hypothetical protein